jgi:hypothetical protein
MVVKCHILEEQEVEAYDDGGDSDAGEAGTAKDVHHMLVALLGQGIHDCATLDNKGKFMPSGF